MKKIYTFSLSLVLCGGLFAQSVRLSQNLNLNDAQKNVGGVSTLTVGDTLLYIPFLGMSVNPTDSAAFQFQTQDLDSFTSTTTNNFSSITMDYAYFYSLDAWDLHPWQTAGDTNFYAAATSWFDNDPALSDDWMEFGPITIPAGGVTLSWFVKTNPTYRDGYEILTSTTGLDNYNDFTGAPIYSRADCYPCTTTNNVDTIWQPVSVNITTPGPTYFAFHHNANGMDVIYFDEILITESALGVNENNSIIASLQNAPNPAVNNTTIIYQLKEANNVSISVIDITGKKVLSQFQGMQTQGNHQIKLNVSNFTAGLYFYTVTAGSYKMTNKMTVTK